MIRRFRTGMACVWTPGVLMALAVAAPCAGGDPPDEEHWPQWRGPMQNGVSRSVGVATRWSETENVAWKTPLPSWSGATPIVWGDTVFVTSPSAPAGDDGQDAAVGRRLPRSARSHPGGRELLLLCIARGDGQERWRRVLSGGNQLFGKQNLASPSPVTDGRLVWALTGTGVVAAFDFDGNQKWRRELARDYGAISLMWGYASSPVLHDGKVIVPVLHTGGPSYLVALDGRTGETVWKAERVTDARHECPDAYTTPLLIRERGGPRIVVSGADWVTAHDPSDGAEVWRASGLNPDRKPNYRIVASPVAADGLVFAPTRVRPLLALRTGGRGDVSGGAVAWTYGEKGAPDVPTPACDGERLYLVDDMGIVACLDARSGRRLWGPQRTAVGTCSASPVVADGKLYVTNESATTTVLAAGPEYKLIGTNQLDDEYTIASPAIAGRDLFIRTSSHLYRIASRAAGE